MTITTPQVQKRTITRADILPPDTYARERKALRQDIMAIKKLRRVEVGPFATFYFENFQTMWHQVHEMLHIEKGGDVQLEDELHAYNPLIPQGSELVATVMFEIDDPVRRDRELRRLTNIETHMFMELAGARVSGVSEHDVERTRADGKTSSVHFVRFPLTAEQAAAFRKAGARITLGFDHPKYGHLAIVPEPVRAALAPDLA
jgi:hypothetical protein